MPFEVIVIFGVELMAFAVIFLFLRRIKHTIPSLGIQISPDSFVFESGDTHFTLDPYYYFDTERKFVLTIGEEPEDTAHATKLGLFQYNDRLEEDTRVRVLEIFLRIGIHEVRHPNTAILSFLLKREVTLRGINTLSPFFCGYQRIIFDSILKNTMHLKVRYE